MKILATLVRLRRFRLARELMRLIGVQMPAGVRIGRDFELVHRGFGTVISGRTVIGDRVRIFHQVTIGVADAHKPPGTYSTEAILIGDDVIIYPGAKIIAGAGVTRIGKGTIIGANAVLTRSTGEYEVWAGVPARKLRNRDQPRDAM